MSTTSTCVGASVSAPQIPHAYAVRQSRVLAHGCSPDSLIVNPSYGLPEVFISLNGGTMAFLNVFRQLDKERR